MSIDGDVNIVIADDSPFIRTAYQRILETQYNFSVVAVAEDGEQAIEKVTELQPDVLVIDVRMPKLDGIEASKRIRKSFPNIALVVVSGHDDVDLVLSLFEDFTASKSYIQKNSLDDVGELIRVVELSLEGKVTLDSNIVSKLINSYKLKYKDAQNILSDSELKILSLYANGFDEDYIADELQNNVDEINKLIDNIASKFDIKKTENINLQASLTLSFIASCINK
ncbi:MAG: response regulator transcription factor [Dehalococcoidia bacterium]